MKKVVILIVVALLIGIWFGINIARDKPLLSNPFAEKSLAERARGSANDFLRDSKDAIKKSLD